MIPDVWWYLQFCCPCPIYFLLFFFLSWICFENSSLFQFFSVCDVKCFLCLCLVCVFFSLWFCFCCFLLANLPFSLRILKTIFDESYNFSLLIWTLTKTNHKVKLLVNYTNPTMIWFLTNNQISSAAFSLT